MRGARFFFFTFGTKVTRTQGPDLESEHTATLGRLQQLVQAARADNGRVFYQLADSVLPAFAPVGRMLCSQLSGNGEVERAHKITGGTYTKVNPNALLVPVG